MSLSLIDLFSTRRSLFHVSFIMCLKSHLRTALTTQNTTKNKYIISHAQNTTALQRNVFLIVIDLLLVTRNGRSAFTSTNHFQGQLQTSLSVSVPLFVSMFPRQFPVFLGFNVLRSSNFCQKYLLMKAVLF